MTAMLKSVTISDFRSINGTITVPLDAPIVLIHGHNGAGKTSILSAIELALTGQVRSLTQFDQGLASHLVHRGRNQGRIALATHGLSGTLLSSEIFVRPAGIEGDARLSGDLVRFYRERCYLAQATLGRLLEIYQDRDTRRSESPLTKFVKDLLGLDHLDSLIEGLHDAGDVRRMRTNVAYWEAREKLPTLEEAIRSGKAQLGELDEHLQAVNTRLWKHLGLLGVQAPHDIPENELKSLIIGATEEPELHRLARIRGDIVSVRQNYLGIQSQSAAVDNQRAENDAAEANERLATWRSSTGARLSELYSGLVEFFPDLPSPEAAGPGRFYTAALDTVSNELRRCSSLLEREAMDAKSIESLDHELERARARVATVDEQIAAHAHEAGALARILSGLLPHLHSEECPVCGREYSEVSTESLAARVAKQIAALTESAGLLRSLNVERANTARALAEGERERQAVMARMLDATARDRLKDRLARLAEHRLALATLQPDVSRGEQLISSAGLAARRLGSLRARDQGLMAIREVIQNLGKALSVASLSETGQIDHALDRLLEAVGERESSLLARQSTRREATADFHDRIALMHRRAKLEASISEESNRARHLEAAKARADERISQARELGRRAREARTRIVRRVFNDALNAVWRDLFVRLAPEEPYVPAFALPENPIGPVEAVLETLHRSGGKGGNPRTMLSAGNLNTAALTLFLALHLSVEPMLPWLVLDDPVQSMDEVHIAQFAALIRTLSKQHGRQIIIAVHEKPLFDYLALELSPAFQGDRLNTIEIGRASDGATVVNYQPVIWQPDAIAA